MANNLSRFDPLSDIARFDPFRNIDDFFKDFSLRPALRTMEAEPLIKMDVSETDQAYKVQAEIPGVKKEDIKVAVDGNQVSINAEIKKEIEATSEGNFLRSERFYGQMSRRFILSQDVDDTQVEAKYQDGILELTLPKKAGTGSKQIQIQ